MEPEERWLYKQKSSDASQLRPGKWDHRLFKIVGSELQYFESELATKPRNVLDLHIVRSVNRTSLSRDSLPSTLAHCNLWALLVVFKPRLTPNPLHLYLVCQNSDQQERWLKYLLLEVERVKSAGAGDESQAADGSRARSVSLLSMDSRTGEGQPKDGRSADQNSEFVEEPVFAAGTNDDDDTRSMMFEDPHNLEEDSSKPGTSGTDDTVSVGPKSGHDDDKAKGSKLELFSTRNKSLKKRGHTLGEIAEKLATEMNEKQPDGSGKKKFEAQGISFWAVTLRGQVQSLPHSTETTSLNGFHRIYFLLPDRALLVFFHADRFVPESVPRNFTAGMFRALRAEGWKASDELVKLLDSVNIQSPDVSLRKRGLDHMLDDDQHLVPLFYKDTEELGQLILQDEATLEEPFPQGQLVIKGANFGLRGVVSQDKEPTAATTSTAPLTSVRGWLFKRGELGRGLNSSHWQRRWCTFDQGVFYYSDSIGSRAAEVYLDQIVDVHPIQETEKDARNYTFELRTNTKRRSYILCAENKEDFDKWIEVLERAIFKADKAGNLQCKDNSAWRGHWFVLRGQQLIMYADRESTRIERTWDLIKANSIDPDMTEGDFDFKLEFANSKLLLRADQEDDALDWINAIRLAMPRARILKKGMLRKRGEKNRAYQERYFELSAMDLAYFENEKNRKYKGSIKLLRVQAVDPSPDANGFWVIEPNRTYELQAADDKTMLDWIDAIKSAVEDIRKQQQLQREMEKQQEQRFEAALERQASENQAAPAAHSSSLDGEEPELQSTEGGNGSASATAALMAVGAAARPNGTGRPGNAKPGSSAFAIEALPQPALDVSDSRSAWAELDKYSMTPEEWDRLQQESSQTVSISPALADVLATKSPHSSLFQGSRLHPHADDTVDRSSAGSPSVLNSLESKAQRMREQRLAEEQKQRDVVQPRQLTAEDEARLLGRLRDPAHPGTSFDEASPRSPASFSSLSPTDVTSSNGELAPPVDVVHPAVLRSVLHTLEVNGRHQYMPYDSRSFERISLSGVVLVYEQGRWNLARGGHWHAQPPAGKQLEELSQTQREVFLLPPHIQAYYIIECHCWYVPDPFKRQGAAGLLLQDNTPARPTSPKVDRAAHSFIRRGGMRFLGRLDAAVKVIAEYACGTDIEVQESKEEGEAGILRRCDDARDPHMGLLVRRDLCSSLVIIIAHGMHTTRAAGLLSLTVWDIIGFNTPKPDARSSPAMRTAYLAYKDLATNPNMNNDNNVRVRSFICAGLNRKFLEPWLTALHNNRALLQSYYYPDAFLRICPQSAFEELLLTLSPLTALPFRLHTVFEMQRIIHRQMQTKKTQDRLAAAAARAAARLGEGPGGTASSAKFMSVGPRGGAGTAAGQLRAPTTVNGRRMSRISVLERHEFAHIPGAPVIGAPHFDDEEEGMMADGGEEAGDVDEAAMLQDMDADGEGAGWGAAQGVTSPSGMSAAHRRPSASVKKKLVRLVRALYDNTMPDDQDVELAFQRGDVLQVQYVLPSNPDWWVCSLGHKQGLVPVNYVEQLTEEETAVHMATIESFA